MSPRAGWVGGGQCRSRLDGPGLWGPFVCWHAVCDAPPTPNAGAGPRLHAAKCAGEAVRQLQAPAPCSPPHLHHLSPPPRVVLKLGARMDMGQHLPKASDGWVMSTYGKDYAVWTKKQ